MQLSGQPFKKTVVRIPSPSRRAVRWISNIKPFTSSIIGFHYTTAAENKSGAFGFKIPAPADPLPCSSHDE
jgi:hypothetical protein